MSFRYRLQQGLRYPSYGIAIAKREINLIKTAPEQRPTEFDVRNNNNDIMLLQLTATLMQYIQSNPMLAKFVQPTIWHIDLHLGNIFVSEDLPLKLLSLIDWQSISVSPLFIHARRPVFLEPPDDYLQCLFKPFLPNH
jgi:hypothetical protein